MKNDDAIGSLSFLLLIIMGVFLIGGGCYVLPQYDVYSKRMSGEAALAHAESERQIATLTAKASQESAKFLADAEITRAKGVAEANKIIGDSLKGNDGYLKYLWIQGMQTNQMQVIYVPTETNLPILEATRLNETDKWNTK